MRSRCSSACPAQRPTSPPTCPATRTPPPGSRTNRGWRFEDCRTAGGVLTGPDTGILAQARSHLDWHARHRFCSVCGRPTVARRGGQVRGCTACDAQHFPRTDPVVITVVADPATDRCLLGQSRGRLSRLRMYSALAGFVDQGEAIEEAVAREVMEEAGIRVRNVRYHSSQPWPFPYSLMIGCLAEAASYQPSISTTRRCPPCTGSNAAKFCSPWTATAHCCRCPARSPSPTT